jgi:hypothetical protein
MTYGYEVQQRNDRMLDVAKRLSDLAQESALPGALLVNYIPSRMWVRFSTSS